MEVKNLLKECFSVAPAPSFEEVRCKLTGEPLHLQVREEGDLFSLMFSDSSPSGPLVDECVGVIASKSLQDIVGFGMTKTIEVIIDPADDAVTNVSDAISEPFESLSFYEYEEGVKLTVYFHEDQWRVSTTRVIDASKAFWTSPVSFRDQFLEACYQIAPDVAHQIETNRREGELTLGHSYSFILISPHNKSLSDVRRPKILHVFTVALDNMQAVDCTLTIPKPPVASFESWEQVISAMQNFNYWVPGYIVTGPTNRYKLFTREYRRVKDLGGNTPDMFRHYLNIRQDTPEKKEDFYKYYPKYRSLAATVERLLWKLSRTLHNFYVMYYVRKEMRPLLDKTVFVTLMQVHEEYRQTGQKRTVEKIHEHVQGLSPTLQCLLLRAVGLHHSAV